MGSMFGKKKDQSKTPAITLARPAPAVPDILKVLTIGDSGVGKTSLIERLCHDITGTFNENGVAERENSAKDFYLLRLNDITLHLWDTHGQERFRTITSSYYRGAHIICVAYDVTNAESYNNLMKWLGDCEKYACEGVKVILVACKIDLDDRRVVTKEALIEDSQKWKIRALEVSSKTNQGMHELGELLIETAKQIRNDRQRKPKK